MASVAVKEVGRAHQGVPIAGVPTRTKSPLEILARNGSDLDRIWSSVQLGQYHTCAPIRSALTLLLQG